MKETVKKKKQQVVYDRKECSRRMSRLKEDGKTNGGINAFILAATIYICIIVIQKLRD